MTSVVITGSTKGIGFGLAREFLKRGISVTISGRSQTSVDQALAALKADAPNGIVNGVACDTSDHTQVESLWRTAVEQNGIVDIWINNAGLARTVWSILDTPNDEINAMVQTNIIGTVNATRVAAKGMLAQGKGKIFTVLGGGSDGEYFPGMGIYGTTKRGLNYFTDALVKELKNTPIVVAKIRPGMIITDGVIREVHENRENFERSRKRMNFLVDHVDTVAPYLVSEMLACEKSGHKIRWLTPKKMTWRLLKGMLMPREDQFARYGI